MDDVCVFSVCATEELGAAELEGELELIDVSKLVLPEEVDDVCGFSVRSTEELATVGIEGEGDLELELELEPDD